MSIFDLFWIFFIISALWPAVQRRMLEAARMRLIHEIEKKRNSRVIALIHRQETMALLGFPIFRYNGPAYPTSRRHIGHPSGVVPSHESC